MILLKVTVKNTSFLAYNDEYHLRFPHDDSSRKYVYTDKIMQ